MVPLFLLLVFNYRYAYLGAQTKRALLIGVGKYPAEGGWASLSSANDLQLIKNVLIDKGYKSEDIMALSDENATKSGIKECIEKRLLGAVRPGDIVYLHYSGHGQQKQDFDGDEVDGYDECIVPYDSPKKFQKGVYEGEKLITDDELGFWSKQIRQKAGPAGQLFVVLDACHSGTGTRGLGPARGTAEAMAPPEYIVSNQALAHRSENNHLSAQDKDSKSIAPMIAFYGAAQNQLNYEMVTDKGEHFGSLTYALSRRLAETKSTSTFRGLFDEIRIEMSTVAPQQTPQAEGDLDLVIANGKLLSKPEYYKATRIISGTEFVIRAGALQDVHNGTEVSVYQADTREISGQEALAKGTISNSGLMESTVKLSQPLSEEIIRKSWIFITRRTVGDLKVRVSLRCEEKSVENIIKESLLQRNYVELNNIGAQIIILQERPGTTVKVLNSGSLELASIEASGFEKSDTALTALDLAIRNFIRGEFIRKMESEGENIQVKFSIIPSENIKENTNVDDLIPLKQDDHGVASLEVGSSFMILIQNTGIKPAYFALIDIPPDNKYVQLMPKGQITAEELRILPDQKILYPISFNVGPPLGQELFKLICADKPVDLVSTKGTRGGIQTTSVEKLLNNLDDDKAIRTRGSASGGIQISDVHIHTETFTITNKKP